jgi:hypothetical protein
MGTGKILRRLGKNKRFFKGILIFFGFYAFSLFFEFNSTFSSFSFNLTSRTINYIIYLTIAFNLNFVFTYIGI